MRDRENVGSILDELREDLQRVSSVVSAEDRRLLQFSLLHRIRRHVDPIVFRFQLR